MLSFPLAMKLSKLGGSMNLKERISLEKKEFQGLKKKYSFKNIHRIQETEVEKENQENQEQKKAPNKK